MNGDGRPDLAVANRDSKTVSVLLGHDDGKYISTMSYYTGITASVALGDLDGDGFGDLAIAGLSYPLIL